MKFNFNPKISVILPAYNCEKTIKKTLNSIINQTYKPYEVIIVNDASTDRTEQIIKTFKNTIPELILINHKENLGQGQARDEAIKASTGEYLAFIDSDDEWHQNKLSSCITLLICTQTKLTFHDFFVCSKNRKNFLIHVPRKINQYSYLSSRSVGNCLTIVCESRMFSNIYFGKYGRLNEDLWAFYETLKKINFAYGIPSILGTQFLDSNSVSANKVKTSRKFLKRLFSLSEISFIKKLIIALSYIISSIYKKFNTI
tara:strand:- start:3282 stop:4052 length:771 start_codon:yes stop_codon:yes gene_type:complete